MSQFNAMHDMRAALARTQPCPLHGAIVVSNSRENAHELWELTGHCAEAKRHEHRRWLAKNDLFILLVHVLHRTHLDTDFHYDRCREIWENPTNNLDLWFRESGKAIAFHEPVPTPDGWKAHGQLRSGDTVFGSNGLPCRVKAVSEVFTDVSCYRITFDDGYSVVASGSHLWEIERRSFRRTPGAWKKNKSESRIYRETVLMTTQEMADHHHRPDRRYAIRVNGGMKLPDRELSIDPYLLGCWLGDGTTRMAYMTSSAADFPHFKKEFEQAGHVVDIRENRETCYVYAIDPRTSRIGRTGPWFSSRLREMGLIKSGDCIPKFVPPQYLRASRAQRLALLQGLMDTDGTVDKNGRATFSNTNENLIDATFELAASLGFKPTKLRRMSKVNGQPYVSWGVAFQAYQSRPPFRLLRKAARCKTVNTKRRHFILSIEQVPNEPVRCIQVDSPDGMYLVGKHMIPTHNSEILTLGQNIRDVLNDPDITIGIFSHTRPMAKGFLRLIKTEFEQNEELKDLFPDILWQDPQRQSPKWAEDEGLIVKRKSNRKEATIEAWGLIDGQPTSKRFKILHYDDVISRKEISAEMIDKATRELENSFALTASDPPLFRYLATYQEIGDTTHQLVQRNFAPVRLHPVVDADGHSQVFSEQKLAWLRQSVSPKVFALQYLLDPKRAATDHQIGFIWPLIRMKAMPDRVNLRIYIVVDPAGHGPHSSSLFSLWVCGIDWTKTWYVLDGVLDRLDLAARADAVIAKIAEWKPVKVGYETYSMQADVEYLQEKIKERADLKWDGAVVKLSNPTVSKDQRIELLIPDARDEKLRFPMDGIWYVDKDNRRQDLVKVFEDQEYSLWPFAKRKDMLDCLSRIKDPALGVVPPRAYRDGATRTYNPWTSGSSGMGSWMSE